MNFEELEEFKLYKNINTYNDQWYMRIKNKLYTCSKYSNYKFSLSSASKTSRVFINFNIQGPTRR